MSADALAEAAKHIVAVAEGQGIQLRVMGGLGVWLHCPASRRFTSWRWTTRGIDIDLVGRARDQAATERALLAMGYELNPSIRAVPGSRRTMFRRDGTGQRGDVSYGRLRFSHTLDLEHRLDADSPTLAATELLLLKLQIQRFEDKDLIDVGHLLCEHDLGDSDDNQVNVPILVKVAVGDWGLYHTATRNILFTIEQVKRGGMDEWPPEHRERILERAIHLQQHLTTAEKTLRFRLRALVGERAPWFEEVQEVETW